MAYANPYDHTEAQRRRRAAKRAKAEYQHPRCVVCSDPIVRKSSWQGPGKTLSAVTCSRKCAYTRANWFRKR